MGVSVKKYSGFLKQNNFDGMSIAIPEFPKVDLKKKEILRFLGKWKSFSLIRLNGMKDSS